MWCIVVRVPRRVVAREAKCHGVRLANSPVGPDDRRLVAGGEMVETIEMLRRC